MNTTELQALIEVSRLLVLNPAQTYMHPSRQRAAGRKLLKVLASIDAKAAKQISDEARAEADAFRALGA